LEIPRNTLLLAGFIMKNFNELGFVYFKEFLPTEMVNLVSQYLENKVRLGEWTTSPPVNAAKDRISEYAFYGDPLVEVLLKDLTEKVSEITGLELYPTYSYARIYQPGESLPAHVDRDSCEISVTVNIANKGEISKIFIQGHDGISRGHTLNPGEAIVYKGREVEHSRLALKEDQLLIQIMLHYVDANNEFSDLKYDKRDKLGFKCVL
jgi:hypothetical protein